MSLECAYQMPAPDSELPEEEKPQAFFGIGFDPLTDVTAFPRLSEAELGEVAPLGERCTFDENETLFSAGDYPYNCFVITSGRVRSVDVSTGERVVCVRFDTGYFTGDIDLLTRRPAPLSVEADTAVEAIRLTPKQLRMLFTRRPQLGEKLWRSYQRRRELLLTSNFRGLTVYGEKSDKTTVDTLELLFRNSVPHEWADISIEENRRKLQELREDAGVPRAKQDEKQSAVVAALELRPVSWPKNRRISGRLLKKQEQDQTIQSLSP